jgi:hypothetical protein
VAAARGRSIGSWCVEHGVPWGKSTTKAAARGGHLEVLQHCVQQGCPIDRKACTYAARGKPQYAAIRDWLKAR